MRWLRRFLDWWEPASDADPCLDALIKAPRYRWDKADEKLRQRTEKRRETAARIRLRAANVESGLPVYDLLRRAK